MKEENLADELLGRNGLEHDLIDDGQALGQLSRDCVSLVVSCVSCVSFIRSDRRKEFGE